jgi:hypothetical protein
MLNRMGHSSSYDDVEAIDTSLAHEILARSEVHGVVVPSNISPGVFVQVAGDNNDINEETLDGKSTTHATTLVLYQKGQFGPAAQRTLYADHSVRRRSLEAIETYKAMREFSAYGKRPDVNSYLKSINDEWFCCTGPLHSSVFQLDLAWTLVRLLPTRLFEVDLSISSGQQIVPGWSGFNAIVSLCVPTSTNVGYCPMINGSPTEFNTVYTVMDTVKAMMANLGQKDSVITFDLAIYVKAKEI